MTYSECIKALKENDLVLFKSNLEELESELRKANLLHRANNDFSKLLKEICTNYDYWIEVYNKRKDYLTKAEIRDMIERAIDSGDLKYIAKVFYNHFYEFKYEDTRSLILNLQEKNEIKFILDMAPDKFNFSSLARFSMCGKGELAVSLFEKEKNYDFRRWLIGIVMREGESESLFDSNQVMIDILMILKNEGKDNLYKYTEVMLNWVLNDIRSIVIDGLDFNIINDYFNASSENFQKKYLIEFYKTVDEKFAIIAKTNKSYNYLQNIIDMALPETDLEEFFKSINEAEISNELLKINFVKIKVLYETNYYLKKPTKKKNVL